ncbi:MAG: serine/threonine protein kinase [Deltaproteobacteria bacterium]|nr:serine/threonine protein kinase [Deltaproteobacteria bacterium]MDQ3297795.1 serine/threonine protein kinase [Myxococcota bacterium]
MIQVGQVLDKYELLERVGQGGMAVVYRGLDRSLKRVVAVKILHKHLSDYQEARDRFEREAQAVAKLRHENILEIFDYSGSEDAAALGSSYIVTEFIEGGTLKQVITDRPITFPEVGAMVILQVCRALAHAHSAGILHRDVKPENIMIRSDGVVKLMDFGISHMVDLERLTVTGQLLGSPAYMAPEHVEGRPIDYRTDVFAAGIVLYQLTVGKLPFEGKNPHEVLKRIAECKFVDPRTANARIGNRLGKIILRAMAIEPNDRFPAIGEMVTALEAYLEESGIAADKVQAELGRYFGSPGAYELALEERLVDHLTRHGITLLAANDRAHALDVFDRVLTIDADNAKVIAILDGINRRTRIKAGAMAICAIGVIAFGAYMIHRRSKPPEVDVPSTLGPGTLAWTPVPSTQTAHDIVPAPVDAGVASVDDPVNPTGSNRPTVAVTPDAGGTVVAGKRTKLRAFPEKNAEYQVEGDPTWRPVPANGIVELDLAAETTISVRNQSGCCQPFTQKLSPGEDTTITTPFLPAQLTAKCADETARVTVDGKTWQLDKPYTVTFGNTLSSSKNVKVEFLGEGVEPKPIVEKVNAGGSAEVTCVPR